jgi:hypothetical protein
VKYGGGIASNQGDLLSKEYKQKWLNRKQDASAKTGESGESQNDAA